MDKSNPSGIDLQELLKPLSREQVAKLSRQDLIDLFLGEQDLRGQREAQLARAQAKLEEVQEEKTILNNKYVLIRSKRFTPSSEKTPVKSKQRSSPRRRISFDKDLCKRYPELPVREEEIHLEQLPTCSCCSHQMEDSGMREQSQYLTVIPKQYLIIRQKRVKYRCPKCHGALEVVPGRDRLLAGSSYSDELILDAALSKYCDLLPMHRYAAMAARQGAMDLPGNSLINLTHALADFIQDAYLRLKEEIRLAPVVQADETPHRMLEGSERKNWFLWAFGTSSTTYFEFQPTRSGEVAAEFLKQTKCEVLVSDVYSGYGRAVSETNQWRQEQGQEKLKAANCNAHARRKFKEAIEGFGKDAEFYVNKYGEIYKLESELTEHKQRRLRMRPLFEQMQIQAQEDLARHSSRSQLAEACNYLLKNFAGLTLCLEDERIPLDNNAMERVIRNPVIGRKTWYGTHSERGAQTAAILMSLIESCRLSKVNPREYFSKIVLQIHRGKVPQTPKEYSATIQDVPV